ncbi:MAG: FUSC family protein [Paucibacter sp.]|nr:FUSC family protein [Roseateles sp.]
MFWPMLMLVALTGFGSQLFMAWGLRAGPMAFVGVLSLVFAMASNERLARTFVFEHAGWTLLGGLLYASWARLSAHLLRRRYRDLALAAALRAGAARLRSRSVRVGGTATPEQARIRASIADDVQLAELLQAARDQVFAAARSAVAQRQTEILLRLIELRDLLLASRLDIDLLGTDAAALGWRAALAAALARLADELDALAVAVEGHGRLPLADREAWRSRLDAELADVAAAPDDARLHLVNALRTRVTHIFDEVDAMIRVQDGAPPQLAVDWTPEQLQPFLSPDGWPWDALKAQLKLSSSVMRHALRSALALSTAFALGHLLPWASHPHWLVLSVAVVLRGNLEQTLSRRNDRIAGTVIGCLIVMALMRVPDAPLLPLVFIVAVGTAHAYVNRRYRVAATAATLMALIQQLMLFPGASPPIIERVADTFVGAMLAWAFCFVLPSWEHHTLARLAAQLRSVMARHTANVLRWAPTAEQALAARLSRQQLYTVLGGLAAAAQRTRVEPESVRLPDAEIEALLSHSYRYAALLSSVQQMLARRKDKLDAGQAQAALLPTVKACVQSLKAEGPLPEVAIDEPPDPDAGLWPEHLGQPDLTPWLLRRLRLARREARLLQAAATTVAKKD